MFPQIISIAFLFPLRIPSGDLQLTRAFADGPISECVTQNDKARIGVRSSGRTDALIIKLSRMGNLDGVVF